MQKANFPLVINFEGDYGMKVIMVNAESTIKEVIQTAADQLIGVVVKPLPKGTVLKARRHGDEEALPSDLKITDAGFVKMETLDIVRA
jgi:toluene monooxygenase system protein B